MSTPSDLLEILLVEDNGGDAYLLQMALENAGIISNLTVFENGADAVEFVQRVGIYANATLPDLAVLDVQLPRRSGIDVLAAIRTNDRMRSVPAVILTTFSLPAERARAEALGIEREIIKPCDLNAFMKIGAILKDILSESQRRQAASEQMAGKCLASDRGC